MRKLCLCLTFNLMVLNLAVMAGVHYDAVNKTLWVTGYEREYACTPQRLLLADQMHGWGIVTREGKQEYVVAAELRIGTDDGCDTYFQIGDAGQPELEFVLNGNLVVMSSRQVRDRRMERGVNRLTLGDSDNAEVRPVLRLAPKTSFLASAMPGEDAGGVRIGGMVIGALYGAEIGLYNSRITCTQTNEVFNRCWLKGTRVELRDVHISFMSGGGVYVLSERMPVVAGCVFEDCGVGLCRFWGGSKDVRTKITGCVFRRCGTAVQDQNRVVFERCRFEQNGMHWTTGDQFQWISFLDCAIDEPKRPNRTGGLKADARRPGWDSLIFMQNTLPIDVKDKAGVAVPGAKLSLTRLVDKVEDQVVSDKAGKAVMVLETRRLAAGDDPEKPRVEDHFYRVVVTAAGYKDTVIERLEATSLPPTLNVVLEQ